MTKSIRSALALCVCVMMATPALGEPTPPAPSMTLVMGGDVMVGRYMGKRLREHGNGDPFKDMSALLQRGDLTLVNLESPVSDVDPRVVTRAKNPPRYSVRFRVPTRYAAMMKAHGIDVAVLANNHTEDCRLPGVADTTAALDAAGLAHVGASATDSPFTPRMVQSNGHTVIVWAATIFRNLGKPRPGKHLPVAYKSFRDLKKWLPKQVRKSRTAHPKALVVVSLHWGGEWSNRPTGGQTRLGRALIDAGANVIMGHHTHLLQPVQAYKEGLILYNMGNLVFDILRPDGRQSAVFEAQFSPTSQGGWRAERLALHPIQLRKLKAGPRPATPDEARRILNPIQRASEKRFDTPMEWVDDTLVWRRSTD